MGQPAHRAVACQPLLPAPGDQIAVAIAATRKEKEKVFRLRYRIYVEEMGKRLSAADHRRRLLYDDMDDRGLLLFASVGRIIAGTVRLHCGKEDDFSRDLRAAFAMDRFRSFPPDGEAINKFSFLSKVMVAREFRSSVVLTMLLNAFYQVCRQQGSLFSFVGCGPHLVPLYERYGFRRYKANFFVPEYGYMIPFVGLPEDIGHLRRAGCPSVYLAERWPNSPAAAEWFAREFPEASRYVNRRVTSDSEFWDILRARLGHPPEKAIGLFGDMTETEAFTCANVGHLVHCRQTDTISYPDDAGESIFIVVTGSVTERAQPPGRRATTVVLRPGQAFGAQAYLARAPQQATITARTDAELLVLPRHALERLGRRNPVLAAKLLYNAGRRAAKKYA